MPLRSEHKEDSLSNFILQSLCRCDFSKFDLDFGFLLKVLKIGEKGVSEMISEPQNRSVDGETARLANDIEKPGLEIGITKEARRTWVCARLWKS